MSQETQHREAVLETEICEHLAAHGWLYSPSDDGYDRELALFPEDVLGWLADSQPEQLEKVVRPASTDAEQEQARQKLLRRLRTALDLDPAKNGGVLHVLRNGFSELSAKFQMAQFKPATGLNPATLEQYGKMRLRVMRQVHYSKRHPAKSLDLVLFVNGIPVATIELKTDFTQSLTNAENQYRFDRSVSNEPLFGFGRGALIHFVVSNSEMKMTTKLAGPATRFLPFNRGDDGAAGNPLNPVGSASSYFWEETLAPGTWLNILHRFVQYRVEVETDPDTGKKHRSEKIIFPRYHQWRAVTRLLETAAGEGPGNRYLVQHSAGSGKTNSISWLAHQLSGLHSGDAKVFDTVIVVTDRTVLDAQLQEAIWQIDHQHGLVVPITREGGESKSAELTKALAEGAQIVIVTIQTFLPTIKLIQESASLRGRSFAVIADEAHSSQTGTTASALTRVLTAEEQAELADGGEIDTEVLLAAAMENTAHAANISFFAFTATPKAKTLELFGRRPAGAGPDALPEPFDLYTMQQAIEEGFILDVLKAYTPYKVAWKLAHGGQEYDDDRPVDSSEARKGLMRWVRLHPTSIAQKVAIIIEHFRENVAHLLDGKAKAMVVTGSRQEAVRYKHYLDAYVAEKGYTDVAALVAFSGAVDDELLGDGLTESNQNPGVRGVDLAEAFKPATYNVMIVANKFQTGFDQPRLVAMYVDKKLGGVQAVQTLSRLNRTTPGKERTYILDFVNDPEDIREAFLPYYRDAHLTGVSDPNLIHDLALKLDASGLYTMEEVRSTAASFLASAGNTRLDATTAPAVRRFATWWITAQAARDQARVEELVLLRRDVEGYVNLYDFIAQIINLEDTDLLARQIFLRLIKRQLQTPEDREAIDLSEVSLVDFVARRNPTVEIELDDTVGLDPIRAVGSGMISEKHRDTLEEIIRALNERFGDEFSDGTVPRTLRTVVEKMATDDRLKAQAKANTESQFGESTFLGQAFLAALLGVRSETPSFIDKVLSDDQSLTMLQTKLPAMMWEYLNKAA